MTNFEEYLEKKYANTYSNNNEYVDNAMPVKDFKTYLQDAYEAGQKSKEDWHKADDIPKEPYEDVWCYYEYFNYSSNKMDRTFGIGYVDSNGKWFGDNWGNNKSKCLAWRYLPKEKEIFK